MVVRDAISSYSRGELAPQKNTFIQPGTYKDSPDTAMTDGVPRAMLKAQRETQAKLKSPDHVRRHLKRHHSTETADNPVTVHARQHVVGTLNQGHSVGSGGELFHGSTDIDAGTANFASEAPPMVTELAALRHVRTPVGAAFFKMSIGTPLVNEEQQYADIKAEHAAAKQALDSAKLKAKTVNERTHSDLLAARRDARAKYPAGHPERLAAERAVRASRKTSGYRDARGGQAHVSNAKKAADAKKDPAFYAPREHITTGAAKTSATTVATGGSFNKSAPVPAGQQMSVRLAQVNALSAGARAQYYAMRNAGISHDRAMAKVSQRPQTPTKVVQQLNGRRKKRG
jgi:hypothetical protein